MYIYNIIIIYNIIYIYIYGDKHLPPRKYLGPSRRSPKVSHGTWCFNDFQVLFMAWACRSSTIPLVWDVVSSGFAMNVPWLYTSLKTRVEPATLANIFIVWPTWRSGIRHSKSLELPRSGLIKISPNCHCKSQQQKSANKKTTSGWNKGPIPSREGQLATPATLSQESHTDPKKSFLERSY